MAAGLPAVVTQNGGPSETLQDEHGTYGILVDPLDPHAIADGLTSLTGDETAWQAMQQTGMQRIADHYTWTRTAQGYLREIRDIVENSNTTRQSYPIPTYFQNPDRNDIDPAWLAGMYFSET